MDENRNNNRYSDEDLDSLISYYSDTPNDSNNSDTLNNSYESDYPYNTDNTYTPDYSYNPNIRNASDESDVSDYEDDLYFNKDAIKSDSFKNHFVIKIDESELDYSYPTESSSDSSSVYFSNYNGRSSSQSANDYVPNPIPNTPVKTPTKSKKTKSVGGRFAIILFVCILVFTTVFSYFSITGINDILAINTDNEDIQVKIPEGATCYEIIDILYDNNLIDRKLICKGFASFRKLDSEKCNYLSGLYTFDRSMGVEGMLRKCMVAPYSADTITLGFPEGWTITQIIEKLDKYKVCSADKLYAALNEIEYEYEFVDNVPMSDKRYQNFEGYIFPDTYDFYVGADASYVIRKFLSSFNSHWTEEYQKRAKDLGYSMDQVITVASIIQKEAADESQMKVVSSVIYNRLRNTVDYPTLGCDSTAIYIDNYVTKVVGASKGSFYRSNYNTSSIMGLPPGPICNPGQAAIEAALYPDNTDYYYFLHDKTGKIYLARTLDEHKNNEALMIKANRES